MGLQIVFAMYPVLLAGAAILWLLLLLRRYGSVRLIDLAAAAGITLFVFLAGPWAFTSYYLRYAFPAVFVLVTLYSRGRARTGGIAGTREPMRYLPISCSVLLFFTMLNASAIVSRRAPPGSLNLAFPLRGGSYYVLQGGDSLVTNPFHALSGSRLALDIVKLNTFGNRAEGVAPRALDDYEIFGKTLYSPCAGTVIAVRDELPDNPPGKSDTDHSEGNYIILKACEAEILPAHLRQGSAVVAAGETVSAGQPLGRAGNSGNSLEPHLHISAREGRMEKGLIFDGGWLTMNSVVIR